MTRHDPAAFNPMAFGPASLAAHAAGLAAGARLSGKPTGHSVPDATDAPGIDGARHQRF